MTTYRNMSLNDAAIASEGPDSPIIHKEEAQFIQNLYHAFKFSKFSDFEIEVKGVSMHVHKFMLAARSKHFSTMFGHYAMKENQENRMVITDFEPEVVRAMLMYIYTSRVPDMLTLAAPLLAIAQKYELTGLKGRCEKVLISRINTQNAADLLRLADMQNAKQMKEEAINFILDHVEDVQKTSGWKTLDKETLSNIILAGSRRK